jgi:hypothetical protein
MFLRSGMLIVLGSGAHDESLKLDGATLDEPASLEPSESQADAAGDDALPQRSRRKRDKRMDQSALSESRQDTVDNVNAPNDSSTNISAPVREDSSPLSSSSRKEKKIGKVSYSSVDDEITMDASNGSLTTVDTAITSSLESLSSGRKVRDKSLDSYASVASLSKQSNEMKGGKVTRDGSAGPKQSGNSDVLMGARSSGVRPVNHGSASVGGKFSSSMIPRDHKKFHPQGWVQAEFSDRQIISDRSRTKEDIRNLEKAWQLRIDLDEHKADELEKKLIECQETVGAYAANMSITSRELRQQFQLLEPLKVMWQEAYDERERCGNELQKLNEISAQKAREDTFEDCKSLTNNADIRRLKSAADIDKYVNRIEAELETSLAGSDARFLMLKDKPNISSGGLRKVTNDSSALLRAERDVIRKVQELKKVAPAVERRFEDKVASGQQRQVMEHAKEQANQTVKAIAMERQKIRDRIAALKETEAQQRRDFELIDKDRNVLRSQLSNLRLEIRAELAERNKQRERYRFVLAQEEELLLRHQLRQDEIAGAGEVELRNQLEAVESARLAKEEAEAHARMLQSSIARFERLKAEVEGFLQPIPQSNDDSWNSSSTWIPSGMVSDNHETTKESGKTDEGEKIGIPKSGWNESGANGLVNARSNPSAGDVTGAGLSKSKPKPIQSKPFSESRDAVNPTPLNLPTVDESDAYKEPECTGDQSYRTLYNSQIYTPSMGDRIREERQKNTEYFENEEPAPLEKTAIPVFKALDFNGSAPATAGKNSFQSETTIASKDDITLAPEFEEELNATMARLFEIKQAQEEKLKPSSERKLVAKQKSSKVVKEVESDNDSSEEVAPLGKMDPVFEAYREELSQEINVAEIREKEKIQRELRMAKQIRSSAAQLALKQNQDEPAKSKSILSAIFTPSAVLGIGEDTKKDAIHDITGHSPATEHARVQPKISVSKRGKKKRKGSKRAHSEDEGGSDNEDAAPTTQPDAIRLALAKVKRKEADRRFWRITLFYASLTVLAALLLYVLYESMSGPGGSGRTKSMSPAQRSRLMSAPSDVPVNPGNDEMAAGEDQFDVGSRGEKEPLLQISLQSKDGSVMGEPLKVYHGLGDPEGVRRDVRAYSLRYRLGFEAEQQIYRSVIEQLEARVRSQVPFPAESSKQQPEGDSLDDSEEAVEDEEEEEATDPEEQDRENADHKQWYEDEDVERPKANSVKGPQQMPESPASTSDRKWLRPDPVGKDKAGSADRQPAPPRGMHMPRPTAAFGKPDGKDSGPEKQQKYTTKTTELEIKLKTATGEYLPPFPVYSDSTLESLTIQVFCAPITLTNSIQISRQRLMYAPLCRRRSTSNVTKWT